MFPPKKLEFLASNSKSRSTSSSGSLVPSNGERFTKQCETRMSTWDLPTPEGNYGSSSPNMVSCRLSQRWKLTSVSWWKPPNRACTKPWAIDLLDDLWDFANWNWNWNSQRTISIYLDLLKEQKKENIFPIDTPVVVDFQLGKKVKSSSANPGLNNCGFTLW